MGDLSRNFSHFEFDCPCKSPTCKNQFVVDQRLIKILQAIADVVGPVRVTSGHRCLEHNLKVPGAAKRSWHLLRDRKLHAADVTRLDPRSRGYDDAITMYLIADHQDAGGIGLYGGGRIHVDTRPLATVGPPRFKHCDRARWTHPGFEHWSNKSKTES